MAKNKHNYNDKLALLQREKNRVMDKKFQEQSRDLVPAVYAGIALALYRNHGYTLPMLKELFDESEEIWGELDTDTMIEMCYQETGILLKADE